MRIGVWPLPKVGGPTLFVSFDNEFPGTCRSVIRGPIPIVLRCCPFQIAVAKRSDASDSAPKEEIVELDFAAYYYRQDR